MSGPLARLWAALTGAQARRVSAPPPPPAPAPAASQPPGTVPVHAVGDPAPGPAIPPVTRGVPAEALDLSKAFEAFRSTPYLCPAGVWTIGYGSTRDGAGRPVTRDTSPIDEAKARLWAARDLEQAALLLAADFPQGLPPRWWAVGVLMNNNLGRMAVWGPTLRRLLLAGDWHGAAEQMRHYRNADGRPSLGLRRRRWAEAAFALGLDPHSARVEAWNRIASPDDWPKLPR